MSVALKIAASILVAVGSGLFVKANQQAELGLATKNDVIKEAAFWPGFIGVIMFGAGVIMLVVGPL